MDRASTLLKQNYGVDYGKEKLITLFAMMNDEGWTEYRFQETFKWFLKNKLYPAWTIADWFQYGVKVYPAAWTYGKPKSEYEGYELPDGTIVYKPKDGQRLPFPEARYICLSCNKKIPMSASHKWNSCAEVDVVVTVA